MGSGIDYAKLAHKSVVKPGRHVDLTAHFDPGRKPSGMTKAQGAEALEEAKTRLFELQEKLYAQSGRAVLVVLQAMDAAGKDSTIKHVMSGLNPVGVDVYSFKAPSATEREHDFMWRHQLVVPALGRIAVFNRSHYENVIVTRVHPEMLWPRTSVVRHGHDPDAMWDERYREINDWERRLTENGTTIVKLFLHLSKEEQRKRFLARIDTPSKNWKVSPSDMAERAYWDDYQDAFSQMLSHTSTEWAPWHVIPADHKWFSRLTVLSVLLTTLDGLGLHYPELDDATRSHLGDIRKQLVAEKG
ncbi:polyphosphate kinase 2 family protein [Gordonia desulfuricans]|uniref:Polyphosphate kinase 2 family protein n=1 Tax=Gordonia desulfuricans TaxID=89051 RepID=A0A7K3LKW1_9ACTN|nr:MULTISPECIES: PPK2 family polyphosphate kinase [Gordonia]EMP15316.1 polyphosphate:nucleotide phosphotransferase [Gordonia sp. NB41Y]NDK88793.1 polyphosphate kinase 2 family protein [Gordonia desulfuricans]WLP92458.1 polyphosphate kinase 2 family protein [Gordonia sp. NB41Y]